MGLVSRLTLGATLPPGHLHVFVCVLIFPLQTYVCLIGMHALMNQEVQTLSVVGMLAFTVQSWKSKAWGQRHFNELHVRLQHLPYCM